MATTHLPPFKAVSTAAVMLFSGTYGFHVTEKLSLIDSFYLSGITFTTIGYGDLPAPVTRSKYIHTNIYIYIYTHIHIF